MSRARSTSEGRLIARIMIANVGQGMPVIWKNAMVPRSPMLHPRRHHAVFVDARCQVWRQCRSSAKGFVAAVMWILDPPFPLI